MGFWGRLFGRRRADPAQLIQHITPFLPSGVRITADQALQISAVWACIDAIAKAIASCRWNIYQPNGPRRRLLLENDALGWILNTRPNPEMTAIAAREALLYIAIPFGNAYAEIVPDGAGRIAEIWPLEHDRVTPRRNPATGVLEYEYRQPDGTIAVLQANRVFHLRGPSINGFLGDNLISRAAKSISVAAAAERFSASFFGMGANPAGALKFPGKLDQETHDRLRKDWAAKRAGPENAHKPLILEAGMEWQTISMEPGKSQLVESRQFSVEEICRWFGVPPHKVQHLLRATFSNIEHLSIEFVRDALTPWCRRLEQEADYKLMPQRRGPFRYTEIDTKPLTFGDANSRAAAHAIWRQNGIMSANEIRASEGLDDAGDDGDVLLVQSNLTTVRQIITQEQSAADEAASKDLDPSVEQDGAEEAPAEDPSAVARSSLVAVFASAMERYGRRIANRRADLEKRMEPDAVEAHLKTERAQLRPGLVAELRGYTALAQLGLGRPLQDADVLTCASLVDAGETPAAAAEKALTVGPGRLAA